jgi:hypothetical protein
MPRARNIKPSFFVNDDLAAISPLGRLLFIGLWTIADREGRLQDKPNKIKVQVLPYDDCDVHALLSDLHKKGFIIRYETDGCPCIQILNFTKHQNPHVKEQDSELPAPDGHHASTMQAPDKHGTCPAESLLLNPDTLNLNVGTDEKSKQPKPQKIKLAEYVSMTKEQHEKLINDYGETATAGFIQILDNYKGAKGKTYKDDYRAILSWVIDSYKEKHGNEPARRTEEIKVECPVCREKVLEKDITAYENYACCKKCAEEGFNVKQAVF